MSATIMASSAQATTFTKTSPTAGNALGSGFSELGGIVLDLIGNNDARVSSQLSASSLFQGYAKTNPFTVGTQTGFDSSVVNALGGGIKEVAVRLSLFDGDTAAENFDFNQNTLLLNGLTFGNWSSVNAQNTDSLGNVASAGFSGGGFRDNTLDTGWFYSNNTTLLTSFYDTLVSQGQVTYEVDDLTPGDNEYDFTQGINASQINVGQGPSVQSPEPATPAQATPEPASLLGFLAVGVFGASSAFKRKKEPLAE
ncbi:MAG: PEP-CTERM sorting domain-containing protein [Xenococcaceae cyanobacterium]